MSPGCAKWSCSATGLGNHDSCTKRSLIVVIHRAANGKIGIAGKSLRSRFLGFQRNASELVLVLLAADPSAVPISMHFDARLS